MNVKKIISNFYIIIIIPTILGGVLFLLDKKYPDFIPPDWIMNNLLLYILIVILIWFSIVTYIDNNRLENIDKKNLENEINRLKNELENERKKSEKLSPIHKRFEYIINRKLKYVAIDYKPFFWKKTIGLKDYPQGIGYELMSKIFEPFDVELIDETPPEGYSWKSIFEDFSEKRRDKLDFIMTPMYETRTRLFNYNVIYSIPLFYSDIGIYVRKNDETKNMKLAFDDALKFLKEKRDGEEKWDIEFLEGEISEILGKKLIKDGDTLSKDQHHSYSYKQFKEKLENVSSTKKNTGDIIFMEIFKAQSIIDDEQLDLVNILNDNQLVYPVSFVIHKEETVLRNFINLRIAELRKNGELKRIIKNNALQIDITDEKVIDKVFLQTYNYKLIDDNFRERQIMFSDRIKEEYDLLEKVYGNYISFQEKITNIINGFPNQNKDKLKILEIGYGTGITSNFILQSNQKMELTLLDNDPGMNKIAKENIINANRYKIEYVNADVFDFLTSCKDNQFDIVVSAYTIHNFEKNLRKELFTLLYSKMKDNSIFINADKYASDDDNLRISALNYRINKFTNYLIHNNDKYDIINEWVIHYLDDQSPLKVMKETESKEQLENIGFKEVKFVHSEGDKEMMKILTAKK